MKAKPLTEQAHAKIRALIFPGDIVIDATVGNGHDSLFMAELVGEQGRVLAVDIQQRAIDSAKRRLEQAGLSQRVAWFCAGHENLSQLVPLDFHGRIKAIMFNLGYLPGADKSIRTRPDTTLGALQQAFGLLMQGGVLSVLAYTGHSGGKQETEAVYRWSEQLQDSKREIIMPASLHGTAPVWLCLYKDNMS